MRAYMYLFFVRKEEKPCVYVCICECVCVCEEASTIAFNKQIVSLCESK